MVWQMGVLDGLAQTDMLEHARFVGSSSGALAIALAACNVPAGHALDRALAIASQHGLFGQRRGLAGSAPLLRQWVMELITPDDVAQHDHRMHVLAAEFWSWRPQVLHTVGGGHQLFIDALMAAVHVPLFLSPRPAVRVGRQGLFFDAHAASRRAVERALETTLGPGDVCLRLDYTRDRNVLNMSRRTPGEFLRLSSQQELRTLYRLGQAYAQALC